MGGYSETEIAAGIIIIVAILLILYGIIKSLKNRHRNPFKLQIHRGDKDFLLSESDDDIIGPVRIKDLNEVATQDEDASQSNVHDAISHTTNNNVSLPKVMCLYVKAKPHKFFYGYDLMQTILNHGFIHGAQQFFHHSDGHRTLFSLANIEAPGSFDLDHMGAFKTSGICFFFQPPRFTRPEAIFDQMYRIATEIAEDLGGIVEDEHHHLMTVERLNDWRSKLS